MPVREIEEKFTLSEVVISAWRSQEVSYLMKQDRPSSAASRKSSDRQEYEDLPDKYFDEEGNLNLSKVTTEEAYRFYSGRLGIPISIIRK